VTNLPFVPDLPAPVLAGLAMARTGGPDGATLRRRVRVAYFSVLVSAPGSARRRAAARAWRRARADWRRHVVAAWAVLGTFRGEG
jgi:hypothetical protein